MKLFKSKRCRTKFCRGCTTSGGRSPYCGKCRTSRWKEVNPVKYFFGKLRRRAKERGHEFSLTLEQYEFFARSTGYLERKGKTAMSLSINRKDPTQGYHFDNIEALTLSQNSRLQFAPMPKWLKEGLLAGIPADQIKDPMQRLRERAGIETDAPPRFARTIIM